MTAQERKHTIARLRVGFITVAVAAGGFLLARTVAAVASSDVTVSPRDNCGGFNGHVVSSAGSTPSIQLYGEVWNNQCPGGSYVYLSWNSPTHHNVQAQGATGVDTTVGVNYETATSTTPDTIDVTVCGTYPSWHCGAPVGVPPPSSPSATTTTTAPQPVVTVTVPVPVHVPAPAPGPAPRERALRVKLRITWAWHQAITELRKMKVGSIPRHTSVLVRCLGHGCPRPARATATGAHGVRRVLRRMVGRQYWAGDRLRISLQAAGWIPERAQIDIRAGRKPKLRMLPGTARPA